MPTGKANKEVNMNASEIENASTQTLLDRHKILQDNVENLDRLLSIAKNEKASIYSELYTKRDLRTGFVKVNGLDCRIVVNNGRIDVTLPEYVPVDEFKRKGA